MKLEQDRKQEDEQVTFINLVKWPVALGVLGWPQQRYDHLAASQEFRAFTH